MGTWRRPLILPLLLSLQSLAPTSHLPRTDRKLFVPFCPFCTNRKLRSCFFDIDPRKTRRACLFGRHLDKCPNSTLTGSIFSDSPNLSFPPPSFRLSRSLSRNFPKRISTLLTDDPPWKRLFRIKSLALSECLSFAVGI